MNITDYKNELILMFAILFMGLLASCWHLAMYKKISVITKNTNNDLEKSLKKSKRIKLGKNKNGNLVLEFYDEKNTKDVFLFKDGLIR